MAAQSGRYFSAGLAGLVVNVITEEQLHAMSDFEVNKALAELLGFDIREMPTNVCLAHQSFGWAEIDYCNTPNDIMPLQIEHKIDVNCVNPAWVADHDCMCQFQCANLLRAISCCLILVLQEKNK